MRIVRPLRFVSVQTTLLKLHLFSRNLPYFAPFASTSRRSSSSPAMASQSEKLVLVLCGKSPSEIELAKRLKDSNAIKLKDTHEISVRLYSVSGEPDDDEVVEKMKLSFDVDSFMPSISTDRFGRLLIWSPRLPSTHDVVSQNFSELPVGSVCVSDVQFKGRGRSKNVWESPIGCLMFSFTIQMEDGRVVPLLQYVLSLSMTEAIKDVCRRSGLPQLQVRIKWPNDLYLNGLKVGGVLCTSTYSSKKFNVSAGIGLNVDNRQPTTCLNEVLKELTSTSCHLHKEDIMCSFFNKFEEYFDLFMLQGFQPLEDLYYKTWLHSGQRVIVQDSSLGQSAESVVTIQGLTSSGYLLAVGDDGQMSELHPDGNSFDFFKGLARRNVY